MLLFVGVVALCALPFAASSYSQPPTVAGESRQDKKGGDGKNTKAAGGQPGPGMPAAVESKSDTEKAGARDQRRENGYDDWNKRATITNAAATIIVAIFTGLLVFFGSRQANATQKSVEAMRESLEETRRANALTLRAWVLVDKVTLLEFTEDEFVVAVRVKNYGKIPAAKIAVFRDFDFPGSLLPNIPAAFDVEIGRTIGAGRRYTYKLRMDEPAPEMLNDIAAGRGLLTLAMRLTYMDALITSGGAPHNTTHAVLYSPDRARPRHGRFIEMPNRCSVS
jgi:hypothetical protein